MWPQLNTNIMDYKKGIWIFMISILCFVIFSQSRNINLNWQIAQNAVTKKTHFKNKSILIFNLLIRIWQNWNIRWRKFWQIWDIRKFKDKAYFILGDSVHQTVLPCLLGHGSMQSDQEHWIVLTTEIGRRSLDKNWTKQNLIMKTNPGWLFKHNIVWTWPPALVYLTIIVGS